MLGAGTTHSSGAPPPGLLLPDCLHLHPFHPKQVLELQLTHPASPLHTSAHAHGEFPYSAPTGQPRSLAAGPHLSPGTWYLVCLGTHVFQGRGRYHVACTMHPTYSGKGSYNTPSPFTHPPPLPAPALLTSLEQSSDVHGYSLIGTPSRLESPLTSSGQGATTSICDILGTRVLVFIAFWSGE